MPVTDLGVEDLGRSCDLAARSAKRRQYTQPLLSRYGTLSDLTTKNGTKNGNDSGGTGQGCGTGMNFTFSCCAGCGVR